MRKTGEILKKAREEKGLSLHEIGLSLKINSKILKAIEEGDDAHLPAKTFLRGFVQSYANFLHLDSEKVLEVFYEEMGSTKPKPYIRPTEPDKPGAGASQLPDVVKPKNEEEAAVAEKTEVPVAPVAAEPKVTPIRKAAPLHTTLQSNKSNKSIGIAVIGIILVGLILFTKKMIDKYTKEAEVPSGEVAQTIEGVTPVNTETSVAPESQAVTEAPLAPMTSAPITPAAPTTPMPSPTPKATPATTPTPAVTPVVAPSPSATPTASATPAMTVSPTPTPTPTPKPTPKEESNKPVELIVEALDSVEIEYSSPTGKPQKIKLSAEQVHTFKSRSGLKINFSNGGAVNLILNGKEVGIPGDLGKPIKLSY